MDENATEEALEEGTAEPEEAGEETAALSGLERATVLLLGLSEEVSAEVMKKMDANDIQQLTTCAARMPVVGEEVVTNIMEDFLVRVQGGVPVTGRQSRDRIRSILEKFLPQEQIEEYMEQILNGVDLSEGFDQIKFVDAPTLAAFVKGEHPQTIALILAHLGVDKASKVLPLLPPNIQTDIILRIANLDRISPQVVRNIQEVFVHEIMASGANKSRQVGGSQAVAELMNNLDSQTVQAIFSELEDQSPAFCEEIRQLMFVFTDLVALDNRSTQLIIKEVTNEVITLALKSAPDDLKDLIFANISSRAAEMIREELQVMGPVKLSDVEAAQQEIVGIARRLEEEGKLVLGGSGGGETLV